MLHRRNRGEVRLLVVLRHTVSPYIFCKTAPCEVIAVKRYESAHNCSEEHRDSLYKDARHSDGIHPSFNTTRIDISQEHVDAIDKPRGRVDIIAISRLVWTLTVGHTQLTTSNIEESEDDLRSINAV